MGRQIPIVMTKEDEKLFINQLKEISTFSFVESFANSPEELFVDIFNNVIQEHSQYYLWNNKLKWIPEFEKTREGRFFIKDIWDAPVVEFCRQHYFESFFSHNNSGRIYLNTWQNEKYLTYDINELIKTYDTIVKKIKKTSAGKLKYSNIVTYLYPESWENYKMNQKDEKYT